MPIADFSALQNYIGEASKAMAERIDNQILQSYTTSTATTATVSYPYAFTTNGATVTYDLEYLNQPEVTPYVSPWKIILTPNPIHGVPSSLPPKDELDGIYW